MKTSNPTLILRSNFLTSTNLRLSAQTAALGCLLAVICYLTAKIADLLVLRPEMVLPFWPGCAVVAAALLATRVRLWPFLLLAGFAGFIAYDLQVAMNSHSIVLLNLGDLIEVVIVGVGLRFLFKGRFRLNSLNALAAYLLIAVVLAPVTGAFIGPLSSAGSYWLEWRVNFLADALALLTLTPAILGWIDVAQSRGPHRLAYFVEASVLTAGLIIVGLMIFRASTLSFYPGLLYSLLPFLLWAALRFRVTGISTSVVFVAFISIWSAVRGQGPFRGSDTLQTVLSLQLFLLFAGAPFMVLATLAEQRRGAAQSLTESEQRFRLVANTAPVMIWTSGTDMLCDYFNQPWLNFTGRPLEAEIGNGWAEAVHPEDLGRCMATYTRAFERREEFRMEYRLRRHDGEYRWILDHGVPRFLRDGSFAGYIGSAIDVTHVKEVQQELAKTTERLELAMETGGIGGWEEYVATGKKVRFGSAARLVGVSPENKTSSPLDFWQQVHPTDRSRLRESIQRAKQTRTNFNEEFRVVWPDGTVHWLRARGRYVYSQAGEPERMLGIAIDVTERKHALEELREKEERLRMAAEAGKMFAYSWDAVTDRVEISGESRQILGTDEYLLTTGQEISLRVHPDDRGVVIAAAKGLNPEKASMRINHRMVRTDGSVVWVETSGQAFFDDQGRLTRIIGMTADITERKRAEEIGAGLNRRLIEAQEADRSRIARDLHDDIGQQLVLLSLEVGQLDRSLRSRGEEVRTRIGNIQQQVAQISASVHGLSHQLHSSSLRNVGLAAAVRSFCREVSEQQSVEIGVTTDYVPEGVSPEVSLCLFRILQEALQNAVKHSGVAHFEVQLQGDASSIQLTVSDLGAGFDPETAMKGTGLGLVSMRERLRLVNGQLSVSSRPRAGTTIIARVPLAQAPGEAAAAV